MATTTVSAWAKPGAWALEAEENDAAEELIQQKEKEKEKERSKFFQFRHQQKEEQQPLSDFPSLSAAVATKTKKKKAVPLSLSEFQTGSSINKNSSSVPAKGLTTDEILSLPTGPRERTAEELERGSGRLGGGFRSYGSGRDGGSDESRGRRDGGFRDRENTRDSGPSRADESGNWGAKKSIGGAPPFERRERGSGGGGFFESQSRADETDDWGAAKRSVAAPPFERRERGGFPDTGSRADEYDSWVSNKSRVSSMAAPRRVGGGFERERREGFGFQKENSNGGGPDSDTWGKKRGEGSTTVMGNGARPKLVLKSRTLSPTNGEEQPGSMTKTKGSNPFGEARPREEILAEKGQDWKKIDEQFDSVKIKVNGSNGTGPTDESSSLGKKSFGNGYGNEIERSWRKPESLDVSPLPCAKVQNEDGGAVAETESATETAT